VAHSYLLFAEWHKTFEILPEQTIKALKIFESNWEENSKKIYSQTLNAERNFDTFTWLANVLLEKSDRASMQNGVEVRVPFLDNDVWLQANKLKIRNTKKNPLKEILIRNFPDAKIPRKKKGLSVNFNEIIYKSDLVDYLKWGLNDKKSFLFFEKNNLTSKFLEATKVNDYLSFRIATLAVWQNEHKLFL
jgi:asparagine synthase (glutamine-hydrolysing)